VSERSVLEEALSDVLACPCGGALELASSSVRCTTCGATFLVHAGIVDLLAGDAPCASEGNGGKEGG
jgi:hypothetical protein